MVSCHYRSRLHISSVKTTTAPAAAIRNTSIRQQKYLIILTGRQHSRNHLHIYLAMASQGVAANSRLAEMQMKFQKKQMLEREQKKLALTGGDTNLTPKTTAFGNGKVRQMFDDRRRGVGIDRSHPLRPIVTSTISTNVTTKTSVHRSPTSVLQQASNKRSVGITNPTKRSVLTNNSIKQSTISNMRSSNFSASNSGNVFNNNLDELDNIDNETFPKEFSSLSLNNTRIMGSHITNDRDFENNDFGESGILGDTVVITKRTSPKPNGIRLNPVITKKSPVTSTITQKITNTNPITSSRVSSTLSKTTNNTIKSPLHKSVSPPSKNKCIKTTGYKTTSTKPATFVMSVKPPPKISTPPPGMASCQYCQRNFNEDRLAKHEEVCGRMTTKKRKIFDASKHRVKGTEAEKYLRKGKVTSSSTTKTVTASIKTTQISSSGDKKGNWRKKHEEFITAIREAKKVQAYLAKGGKLSDLPPPPPSENPDYVQCPHCGRRFNESAAERHIPKCANMQHNKPKPSKKRF